MKLRRIFHPTDFSPTAAVALRFALETARRFEAELHVGHVVYGDREYWDDDDLDHLNDGDLERRLREHVFSEMVRMNWEHDHAVRLHYPVIRHATPDSGILRFARAQRVDLIVLGMHGRRGVRRFLLGSVASRVLHGAHTDLVVVPFGHRAPADGRILAPVDLCDRSAPLIRSAAELAWRVNAPLDLLHVLDLPLRPQQRREGVMGGELKSLTEVAAERLEILAREVENRKKTLVHVKSGSPGATILQFVDEHEVRLVMMASSGTSPDERVRRNPKDAAAYHDMRWAIGPVTERVVTHSDVPVWVLKRFSEPSKPKNQGVDVRQYTMSEIAREV